MGGDEGAWLKWTNDVGVEAVARMLEHFLVAAEHVRATAKKPPPGTKSHVYQKIYKSTRLGLKDDVELVGRAKPFAGADKLVTRLRHLVEKIQTHEGWRPDQMAL